MREMKDSNVNWLNAIPCEWALSRIKYVLNERIEKNDPIKTKDILSLTAKQGVIPLSKKQGGGNKPKEDFTAYKLAYPNDIVVNSMNILSGSVGLSKYFGCVSPVYYMLRPFNDNFDVRYFNYIFQTKVFQLSLFGLGNGILIKESGNGKFNTIRMRIPMEKFGNLLIPVPNKKEQQQIADYLDTQCSEIDATSEDIQKEISLLEEYKKSVITEAVTKGLNPDVEMKDSGIEWIGEIPKDWEFPKITHILDYTHPYPIGDGDHGTIKAENYSEEGIPFIRVQNLGFATELIMNNVVYITEKQNNGIINSTLYPNDILFAKTGATIGKVGIMPENIKKANTTSHVGKITVSEEVVPKYIFYVLSSFIGYKQFWDIALMKSTRPELSIDEIKTLHVLLPKTKEEQQQIADFLDTKCSEIDSLIADKKRQLDILADYKKSLIYEYVTGKKEVPVNK